MKIKNALGVALLVVVSLQLHAQTTNGRILGTVHDQTGAAISNATVVVTDTQRSVSRQVVTDDSGNFVVAALPPSVYTIRVEAKGFKTVEHQGVQLEVARDISLDFTLPAGAVRQEVVVSSEVPMVNTTNATLGGTLSNKEIIDLPLNGRNYENLLQLRPGVMRYPGGGFSTTSANGLRAEDNVYLIDGLYNSEPFSGQSIINGAGIAGDEQFEAAVHRISDGDAVLAVPKRKTIVEGIGQLILELHGPCGATVRRLVNPEVGGVVPDGLQVSDFVTDALHVAELKRFGARHHGRRPGLAAVGRQHKRAAGACSPHDAVADRAYRDE